MRPSILDREDSVDFIAYCDSMRKKKEQAADEIRNAIELMARLRAPDGCPWDRKQTFDSIMRHTLEETYEVFDAIERRAWPDLKDELGDLLLQVLFYSQLAAEAGYFTIDDVAAGLNAKLIRRHPHVFGNASAETVEEVNSHWSRIKAEEKARTLVPEAPGLMEAVPRHMPAMIEARLLGEKAASTGFDWPDSEGVFQKLQEEIRELQAETASEYSETVAAELGDVFFTAVNLARHLQIDPEFALRTTNAKFRKRFASMEAVSGGTESLRNRTAEELESLWREAKQGE